jgi:endonuclease YncB( thermonuclease family)
VAIRAAGVPMNDTASASASSATGAHGSVATRALHVARVALVFVALLAVYGAGTWWFVRTVPSRDARVGRGPGTSTPNLSPSARGALPSGLVALRGDRVQLPSGRVVRLRGIVASDPSTPAGRAASRRLAELLSVPPLALDTVNGASHDADGALVGYLRVADTIRVNASLLAAGLVTRHREMPRVPEEIVLDRILARPRSVRRP